MSNDCVEAYEVLTARGHENIKALHRVTFEFTKDEEVTPKGDCILGVKLDKAVADLDPDFKKALRKDTALLVIVIEVDNLRDIVLARGSSRLLLEDDRRVVVRRSRFIGRETLAIEASKAARDIDRRIVEKLRNRNSVVKVHLYVIDMARAGLRVSSEALLNSFSQIKSQ
jgi:hypothetical protein